MNTFVQSQYHKKSRSLRWHLLKGMDRYGRAHTACGRTLKTYNTVEMEDDEIPDGGTCLDCHQILAYGRRRGPLDGYTWVQNDS